MHENEHVSFHPEWKALYVVAKDWDYDSFHEHEEFISILQMPKSRKYYDAISRVNNLLLVEQSKWLDNQQGKGYRVIKPNEHVKVSGKKVRMSLRKMKQGMDVAANTNTEELTQQESQQLAEYLQRAGMFKSLCESNVRKLSRIAGGKIDTDVPKLPSSTDTEDKASE